ncbi:hypothetical protein HY251_06980, partial [bacterium]|nr:hypothetical protein [bacterium]
MSPEQGKPQERVARAREVVRHLVKALKIRRLYGAKNVNANGAREQLGRELASYLDVHGTLELEVTRDSFALEGAAVYDEPSQEANLAFGLYLGGVRELTVSQGVQDDELEGLVAILADNRAEDREI